MAATIKDIVNMLDTVKHRPRARRVLEAPMRDFAEDTSVENAKRNSSKNTKLTEKVLKTLRSKN